MNKKIKLTKSVSFAFITKGNSGHLYVEADCKTKEDFKEALEFAKEASKLIPQIK
ncbi:hypothetical protein ACSXAY_10280 [Clostridium perfringens]